MTLRLRPQRPAARRAKMTDRISRLRYGQVQRRPRRKFFIRSRPVLGNGPGPGPTLGQCAEMYLISPETDKAGSPAVHLTIGPWKPSWPKHADMGTVSAGRGRRKPRVAGCLTSRRSAAMKSANQLLVLAVGV